MPLPALHCRFAQAIAKTAMAPDLSLRGCFAPVAISGRHCRSALTTVEMSNAKVWCVAALSERHAGWQYLRHTFYDARLPDLSLREGRRPTWQSRGGSCVFAGSVLLSGRVLRDCHVASLLAMTRQGSAVVRRYSYSAVSSSCRVSTSSRPGLRRRVKSMAHGLEKTSSLWPR